MLLALIVLLPFVGSVCAAFMPANARNVEAWLAGAVELGFLGGAAGNLGSSQGMLLLVWRFYTNGVGVILGALLAIRLYGWPALRRGIRLVLAR